MDPSYSAVSMTRSTRSGRFDTGHLSRMLSQHVLTQPVADSDEEDDGVPTIAPKQEREMYIPWDHRDREFPTTDLETFILLMKACVGTGIFAMPRAFYNSGLWCGLIFTVATGLIVTYCANTLIKCSHVLCKRFRKPFMTYAGIAKYAFLSGPENLRSWAKFAGNTTFVCLAIAWVGVCSVFIMFVVESCQSVLEFYTEEDWNVRIIILMLCPLFLVLALIRNLKIMAVAALMANIIMVVVMGCTFYYICTDLPSLSSRPFLSPITKLPLFFSITIFAMAEVGVEVSLENNMKTPNHFIGWHGVLSIAMMCIVVIYTAVGFFGYLKYGDSVHAMVTLDFPVKEPLAQAVNVMIAVASYQTYGLQFFVTVDIIWNTVSHRFEKHNRLVEYLGRTALWALTVVIAVALPMLEPIMALVGAVCVSTLGLMLPPFVEIMTCWYYPELGHFHLIFFKNVLAILFGVVALVTGTWMAIHNLDNAPHED